MVQKITTVITPVGETRNAAKCSLPSAIRPDVAMSRVTIQFPSGTRIRRAMA
jgi:hypothetical protein